MDGRVDRSLWVREGEEGGAVESLAELGWRSDGVIPNRTHSNGNGTSV